MASSAQRVGSAMTGIGIAVSLMPPLVATGIGLFDPANDLAIRAVYIFLLNVAGDPFGSIVLFLVFGINREHRAIKIILHKPPYLIYVLCISNQSKQDNNLYTGPTNDLRKRLE